MIHRARGYQAPASSLGHGWLSTAISDQSRHAAHGKIGRRPPHLIWPVAQSCPLAVLGRPFITRSSGKRAGGWEGASTSGYLRFHDRLTMDRAFKMESRERAPLDATCNSDQLNIGPGGEQGGLGETEAQRLRPADTCTKSPVEASLYMVSDTETTFNGARGCWYPSSSRPPNMVGVCGQICLAPNRLRGMSVNGGIFYSVTFLPSVCIECFPSVICDGISQFQKTRSLLGL
jgi:hypothetical protein